MSRHLISHHFYVYLCSINTFLYFEIWFYCMQKWAYAHQCWDVNTTLGRLSCKPLSSSYSVQFKRVAFSRVRKRQKERERLSLGSQACNPAGCDCQLAGQYLQSVCMFTHGFKYVHKTHSCMLTNSTLYY